LGAGWGEVLGVETAAVGHADEAHAPVVHEVDKDLVRGCAVEDLPRLRHGGMPVTGGGPRGEGVWEHLALGLSGFGIACEGREEVLLVHVRPSVVRPRHTPRAS
jgi:hypothetical protein